MRLVSEIMRVLQGEVGDVLYTVAESGAYFQNVKRIAEFSETTLVLRGRKGALRVEGRGLTLFKYSGGDVAVRGEILRIGRE